MTQKEKNIINTAISIYLDEDNYINVEGIADDEHFTGDIDAYSTDEIINIINHI